MGNIGAFYDGSSTTAIRRVIEEVVECEGPISLELLTQRVAERWGIRRAAHRVRARVANVLRRADVQTHRHGRSPFVWPAWLDAGDYDQFRVPGTSDDSQRKSDQIAPEEIASAARYVLSQQISLPFDDLVRETARLLGFQRLGANVAGDISSGVQLLLDRNEVEEDGGMIAPRD